VPGVLSRRISGGAKARRSLSDVRGAAQGATRGVRAVVLAARKRRAESAEPEGPPGVRTVAGASSNDACAINAAGCAAALGCGRVGGDEGPAAWRLRHGLDFGHGRMQQRDGHPKRRVSVQEGMQSGDGQEIKSEGQAMVDMTKGMHPPLPPLFFCVCAQACAGAGIMRSFFKTI
jgi:hypothetical protein